MSDRGDSRTYIGDVLPKWVDEGVYVRVKSTPETRKYGLPRYGGGQDLTWANEVGVIRRSDGNGWWDWRVHFPRGLSYTLDEQLLSFLTRSKATPKPEE